MKDTIYEKAPAKINLSLDILGKREDGYHNMRMLNHSCTLHDTLSLTPGERYSLKSNIPQLEKAESNLVTKALRLLSEEFGKEMDFTIGIEKRIPMEAGLAGGSADAAAAMRLAARHWGLDVTPGELERLAIQVGADVLYCLQNTTALVEGIGERITPLEPFRTGGILILKPDIDIKSPEAFSWVDSYKGELYHPDISKLEEALKRKRLDKLRTYGGNTFLKPVGERYPEILELIKRLYESGAFYAGMSGSGSTVMGYFDSEAKTHEAFGKFSGVLKIKTDILNEKQ